MADVELNEVEQVFRDNGVSAESSGAFLACFGDGITFQDLSTSTEADLEEVLADAQVKRTVRNERGNPQAHSAGKVTVVEGDPGMCPAEQGRNHGHLPQRHPKTQPVLAQRLRSEPS